MQAWPTSRQLRFTATKRMRSCWQERSRPRWAYKALREAFRTKGGTRVSLGSGQMKMSSEGGDDESGGSNSGASGARRKSGDRASGEMMAGFLADSGRTTSVFISLRSEEHTSELQSRENLV